MPKIEKLFAFVAEDKGPDDEGIIGMSMGNTMMPFVGADQARIKSLLEYAKQISKMSGKPFRILEFSERKDVTNDYLPWAVTTATLLSRHKEFITCFVPKWVISLIAIWEA